MLLLYSVRGIHLNLLAVIPTRLSAVVKYAAFLLFPNQLSDGPMPRCMIPDPEMTLEESAYFHQQATKPDTLGACSRSALLIRERSGPSRGYFSKNQSSPRWKLGFPGLALLNSPVGLAAWLMEKFSLGVQPSSSVEEDAAFRAKINLDHILSNVMTYYASNSAVSSSRFYREIIRSWNLFRMNGYD